MQILSNWKLTFDPAGTPLAVLAFGQIMDGEFAVPWAQSAQASGRVRAPLGARFARGNVVSGISLTTYKDHASDAAARLWCLQTNIALNSYSGVTSKLRLEIQGSAVVCELQNATLDRAVARLRVAGVPRTLMEWSIGGTGWVQLP